MFSKFKLNDIVYSDFMDYESLGKEYYAKIQTDIQSSLSIALSRMIDKCESVFFLNSESSISIPEEINKERTTSPWIYNELSLADMIEIRPIRCYRDKILRLSHSAYDAVNESSSLQVEYKVDKIETIPNFV